MAGGGPAGGIRAPRLSVGRLAAATGSARQRLEAGGERPARPSGDPFYGDPDLHEWLSERAITGVAITGIQTNMCCETTARMAGNLGYETLFVLDATCTFDLPAHGGGTVSAEELARVTATNLQDDFADVVMTADLLG
jgi:nicotinamidase-related amidase